MLARQFGSHHVEDGLRTSNQQKLFAPTLQCDSSMIRRQVPARRRIFLACLALLAGSPLAYAGEGDVFTPYVGYSIYSDDNLSRQPDDGNQQSDTWRRSTFGLRVNKEISRQRVTADVSINDTKFDRFTQFDNDGRKLAVNWAWVVGNHLSGNVGTSLVKDLTPFGQRDLSIADSLGPSVRTQRRSYLEGGWRFHPAWRVRGSFNRYDVAYEEIPLANLKLDISEVGIDYLARSQNKIGLLVRHSDGEYPNGFDNTSGNYTQDEVKASASWKITGKTDLEFLGGWAQRNYKSDFDRVRDFTGPDGRLTVNWAATGKTGLTLAVYRELGSGLGSFTSDDFSNFSRNTGASLGANWQATAKLRVDASTQSEKRDYNGIGVSEVDRSDRYRKHSIGVTFLPYRQLNIRASVYQQQLDSNIGTTYRTKGFQLITRYEF